MILFINKKYGYCTNINDPKIEPLFGYFRLRVHCNRFPVSDTQRIQFDKIIINLCHDGYIYAPHWVLWDYFNRYKNPRWQEYSDEVIHTDQGDIKYSDVKSELKVVYILETALRTGKPAKLNNMDVDVLERIYKIDSDAANRYTAFIETPA